MVRGSGKIYEALAGRVDSWLDDQETPQKNLEQSIPKRRKNKQKDPTVGTSLDVLETVRKNNVMEQMNQLRCN